MSRLSPARMAVATALACLAAIIPAAALAAAGPTAGASPSTTAAATPKCATSNLVVWLDTNGNGTAGSIYYTLEFTNLSAKTCTVGGYPGVSAINLAGRQLGSPASRDRTTAARTITLAPGAAATAVLRIVEAGNFPSSSCHMVNAAGLRVFPPNQTGSKVVPFPFDACSLAGPVYLQVRAVTHG